MFDILQQEQWRVKRAKCSFARRELTYLEYVISEKGVATCLKKVQAVADWLQPKNIKDLRNFCGLHVTIVSLCNILA
jgi:hypothetical protein